MKKIAVLIADGTEELEALTPVDVLRRTGAKCDLVSVNNQTCLSSHNVVIKADKLISEIDFLEYDAVVVPGGMPGATNISDCEKAIEFIKHLMEKNKLVASICASPAVVLSRHRLINGKKVTCYPAPDFINALSGCLYTGEDVEVDGNVITANGPLSAMKFAFKISDYLELQPKF